MTAANTVVAICNRALQHCGVGASDRITALTDDTKYAAAVNFVYDRLRQAELRRNLWSFSTRRQVLRPITTDDKIVTFPTYSAVVTYDLNDIVVSSGIYYRSLSAANIANTPATATTYWEVYNGPLVATLYDSTVPFYAGEVLYSNTTTYLVLVKIDAGDTPVDGTDWHVLDTTSAVPTLSATTYTSPVSGRTYAFNLPRDFLRMAPEDPKYISQPNDYLIENKQIITDNSSPIFLRYVRDEEDPTKFDPLFNEGLSCRIALEVCEELTQSSTKLANIAAKYNQAIGDARLVDAIERGPTEAEEDDLITVRR